MTPSLCQTPVIFHTLGARKVIRRELGPIGLARLTPAQSRPGPGLTSGGRGWSHPQSSSSVQTQSVIILLPDLVITRFKCLWHHQVSSAICVTLGSDHGQCFTFSGSGSCECVYYVILLLELSSENEHLGTQTTAPWFRQSRIDISV